MGILLMVSLLAALIALDVAAWRWGMDSTDARFSWGRSHDWRDA
jgi:hypothetical protein